MDSNVKGNPDFIDLRTRAEFLELCGESEAAEELRVHSLSVAREVDLTCYSYQLLWRNLVDEAIDLLERNAARNPGSWNAWDSLGEAYAQKGDIRRAIDSYAHAAGLIETPAERMRIERIVRDLLALGAIAS